eukprot:58791-Rhodomonas_salina.1
MSPTVARREIVSDAPAAHFQWLLVRNFNGRGSSEPAVASLAKLGIGALGGNSRMTPEEQVKGCALRDPEHQSEFKK